MNLSELAELKRLSTPSPEVCKIIGCFSLILGKTPDWHTSRLQLNKKNLLKFNKIDVSQITKIQKNKAQKLLTDLSANTVGHASSAALFIYELVKKIIKNMYL